MKSFRVFISLFIYLIEVECGLYPEAGVVVELDAATLQDAITGRPHAWLIEFYASWCGHCRDFAPFYTQFAEEVAFWGDVIKIGAIDCADWKNEDICSDYDIKGYPSVKYFAPHTGNDDLGILRESWSSSLESLKEDAITFIQNSQDTMNLTEWPSLEPITDLSGSDNVDLFIILEAEDSFTGREVLLDIHNAYNGSQNVVRMLLSENSTLFPNMNYSELPALLRYHTQTQSTQTINISISAGEIEEYVYSYYMGANSTGGAQTNKIQVIGDDVVNNGERSKISHEDHIRYTVSLSDLEKTVVYALTHEIRLQGELSGEKLAAFQKFVQVLADFFPAFSSLIYPINQISTFDQQNIVEKARDLIGGRDEEYNALPWRSCAGSQPQFGGYPCGQWMLWHTLTVSQLREKKGPPTQVLEAMLAYIKNFFGCLDCAEHFVNATQNGEQFKAINTYQDAVLYLWDLHNDVNLRLQNSSTDDPVYPKQIFPSTDQCPECYTVDGSRTEDGSQTVDGSRTVNGSIYRSRVLEFLVDTYSSIIRTGAVSSGTLIAPNLLIPVLLAATAQQNVLFR